MNKSQLDKAFDRERDRAHRITMDLKGISENLKSLKDLAEKDISEIQAAFNAVEKAAVEFQTQLLEINRLILEHVILCLKDESR